MTPKVLRWWEKHKRIDRKRKREEATDRRREKTGKKAMMKLTPKEKEALGL